MKFSQIVGGIVIAGTIAAFMPKDHPGSNAAVSAATNSPTVESRDALNRHYCTEANAHEDEAFDLYNKSKNYRAAYKAAVAGLWASQQCDDSWRDMRDGYLLSVKGLAEHNLPEGDSQTDLNQANTLLMKCQTTPGLYGTHDGAACQTQMQNNISWQVAWGMGR